MQGVLNALRHIRWIHSRLSILCNINRLGRLFSGTSELMEFSMQIRLCDVIKAIYNPLSCLTFQILHDTQSESITAFS
jgi:hypothetical protein